MAVGKAEVLAAIAAEREQVLEAIRKVQDENQPEDLSDLLAAVQGIYEDSPVSPEIPQTTDDTDNGVEPIEEETASGPSGEATPEGEVSEGEVTPAGGV